MNTTDKLNLFKDYDRSRTAFHSAIRESGNDPEELWDSLDSYTAQELICELITMGIVLTYNPKN